MLHIEISVQSVVHAQNIPNFDLSLYMAKKNEYSTTIPVYMQLCICWLTCPDM